MKVRSKSELDELRKKGWECLRPSGGISLVVGMASCGLAAGAEAVYRKAVEIAGRRPGDCRILKTGCLGFCQREPLVEVRTSAGERMVYGPVASSELEGYIEEWSRGIFPDKGKIGPLPPLPPNPPPTASLLSWLPDHPFYKHQVRLASRNCGHIDPEDLAQALALGSYQGLARCLSAHSPEEVLREVKSSGLRGRGGAGYPTGSKWETARNAPGANRYLICNADEGDPGAYMDRSLLEGDPHAILEGMIIGAYATGSRHGLIYVRMEYPLAIERMRHAIEEASSLGFLGEDILGTGFAFDVDIVEGAGAFVSGEETALIAAIEGRMAEPRPRPPYPAIEGLYGCPTIINNVETWANIPMIIENGASWFAGLGTAGSKGTKVFSLVGAVAHTGLVEVPMGTPLRAIVEEIGGGARPGRKLKAVQTGGPSGGCIPAERFDLPVDYESLAAQGSIMGSGGMVVLDDESCMVDIARYFLDFTRSESCGKCTPCREGLDRMLHILENIADGKGTEQDLDRLIDMSLGIKDASLCGLGKSAPNPILTTLNDFRHEYLAHVLDRSCPAGVCKALITYGIDSGACSGCEACAKFCPTGAISGEKDLPHRIEVEKCVKCGACREVCRFEAIRVGAAG